MRLVPRNNRFAIDLFDDFFREPFFQPMTVPSMKTDVKETDNQYILTMDLPGFAKEDIKISLDNGYVTISATKQTDKEEKDEAGRTIRQERSSGSSQRSFYVGEHVRREDFKASHNNGVLELRIPKQEAIKETTDQYIPIE